MFKQNYAGSLQKAIADTRRKNFSNLTSPCAMTTFQSKKTANLAFYAQQTGRFKIDVFEV